jgi:D-alanyl-lipoteichoic acid acyltransferase DltB (MBOAT superfamily)
MYFNSFTFALFLPVVWFLYWFVGGRSRTVRNAILLTASYVFYGWWDWRFLSLIVLSSSIDLFIGRALGHEQSDGLRRWLLAVSVIGNLGLLALFKYYDFFAVSLAEGLASVGYAIDPFTLGWVLPVGISFYTFQTMSYTIDVYRRRMEPAESALAFFTYVAFFPQLVAGPIERASHLLPQFHEDRVFDPVKATDGLRQILWGLFKKAVIADACGPYVDKVFAPGSEWAAGTLFLGTFLFAFQIYCDFSGYSDIAIGTARLFSFDLTRNFATPYFSRDIAEFWRRWHITLNTWFRDYVYIPLGGSQVSRTRMVRNILIIFLLSGLWHGANWTYVFWGLINAMLFLPILLSGRNRRNLGVVAEGRLLPSLSELAGMTATFLATLLAWVFFRASTVEQALSMIGGMIMPAPGLPSLDISLWTLGAIGVLLGVEWFQRGREHGLSLAHLAAWQRRGSYAVVFLLIFFLGRFSGQDFIYFQF